MYVQDKHNFTIRKLHEWPTFITQQEPYQQTSYLSNVRSSNHNHSHIRIKSYTIGQLMTIQVSLDSKYKPHRCIQQFKCHVTQFHKIKTQVSERERERERGGTDNNGNDLHEYMMQTTCPVIAWR